MTGRGFHRNQWLRNLFFVAAAGAIGTILFAGQGPQRLTLTALEAQEAAALCAKEGVSLADFWRRAEVMGLGGVVVREESLKGAARRGELLMFSRDEVEKWRMAGLISPAVPLNPDTVWIKDAAVLEQVLAGAARYGIHPTTSTMSGYHLVHFPESLAVSGTLDESGVGSYDPDIIKSLEGRGLVRVFARRGENRSGPVMVRWKAGGGAEGFWPMEGPKASGVRVLEPRSLPIDAEVPRLLRAIYSQPARLLVLRLAPAGVEANFDRLRGVLQEVKRRGLPLGLPAQAPPAGIALDPSQRILTQLLLWLFGIFGPLLAARAGLVVLKRTRIMVMANWPVAAPVLQLLAGVCAAGLASVCVGLAARACFDSLGWLSPFPDWSRAALVAPLVIALLTLYTIDVEEWVRRLSGQVTWVRLLGLSAILAAAVLLIEPRRILAMAQLSSWAQRMEGASTLPWWWSWRWREIVVGWPCLLQAFFLINWRMDCPDCASLEEQSVKDPRTWFIFGLLAPIGIIASVGQELAPRDVALAQTAWSALAGLVLGAALIAVRLRGLHGTKDPGHHRTIDPDSPA